MRTLCEFLRTELLIVQAQKDVEAIKKENKNVQSHFHEDEDTNAFYGQNGYRGNRGRGGSFQRGGNQRGNMRGGNRLGGFPRKEPKYPVDEKALKLAISRLKPGQKIHHH